MLIPKTKFGIFRLLILASILIYGLFNIVEVALYPNFFPNLFKPPVIAAEPFKDMTLRNVTPGSDISSWLYFKDKNLPTVIYFYGNGESIGNLNSLGLLDEFIHLVNYNFIFFDYPSYGNSTGKPNQYSLVSAGLKLVDWVIDNYPRSPIIIWGRSLGAGVAAQVISQRNDKVSKFILMSPWNDLTELANYHYPLLSRALPEDTLHGHEYDTYKALKDNNKPGLVVMAENDKIIPTKFSKKLLHQLSDSKIKSVIIKGVRHNDIYNKRTWAYILNFLKKI